MSPNGRSRSGKRLLHAFQGEVGAVPDEERDGAPTALAMAIAEAAQEAAAHLSDNDLPETKFEVTRIEPTGPLPGALGKYSWTAAGLSALSKTRSHLP